MFVPPPNLIKTAAGNASEGSLVCLKSSHLWIGRSIAEQVFGQHKNVYAVYYPSKNSLLLAPVTDDLFSKIHKASQHLLKDRNLLGDKTIALHEMLIDHQMDATDRELEFTFEPALGVLNVKL